MFWADGLSGIALQLLFRLSHSLALLIVSSSFLYPDALVWRNDFLRTLHVKP